MDKQYTLNATPYISMTFLTTSSDNITRSLLAGYLLVLGWILLLKFGVEFSYMSTRMINLVPFPEFVYHGRLGSAETVLNVIVFIPLGVYIGLLYMSMPLLKKLALFFAVSLVIELLQYVFAIGALDITDLITNTTGGMIGLAVYRLLLTVASNRQRAQRFINIAGLISTLVVVVLLVLLKLDKLPIRYR